MTRNILFTDLPKVIHAMTPNERLRACAEAHLDLRTLFRIRANKAVRPSSTERLVSALEQLGYVR